MTRVPAWARRPAPPPPPTTARLAPSAVLRLVDEEADAGIVGDRASGVLRANALTRGRLVHRLLQSLPDHPPEARGEVAARYLGAIAPEVDGGMLIGEIMAILDDPAFAPLFRAGSRAEVEIEGRVGDKMVSGRIDRLAVTKDRVLIVDYKTNRPAPRTLAEVSADHIAQLALYRRVLSALYPDRPVVASLLWTDIPALMEVPSGMLAEAESAVIG